MMDAITMTQTQQPGTIAEVLCVTGADASPTPLGSSIPKSTLKESDEINLNDLLNTWYQVKDRRSLDFSWRDRVEYQIIRLDAEYGRAVLCPDSGTVLRRIERANSRIWAWRPGFAKFTIEAATFRPYSPQLEDLLAIEQNFTRRRQYLRSLMNKNQAPFTLSILPDLEAAASASTAVAVTSTTEKTSANVNEEMAETNGATESSQEKGILIPKYVIPQHRAVILRARSLSVGVIPHEVRSEPPSPTSPNSPLSRYPRPSRPRLRSVATAENLIPQERPQTPAPAPPALESGARGLHVTFGCHDLREARYLHDQLCVISPIMLAFTASTPVYRGVLSDFDIRLNHNSKSAADCRPGEKCSLARPWRPLYPTYLGLDAPRSRITRSTTNKEVFQRLRMEGLDDALAMFCAQGFTCTTPHPGAKDMDANGAQTMPGSQLFHQFTTALNPYVQLELPSLHDARAGFRVTFGAIELQLTDFSNAACIFFVALLRFAILGFDLDFRLPPHMVAENVAKAHKEDGLRVEKFWWRSVRWTVNGLGFANNDQPLTTDAEPSLVSIDHIINGDPARPETVGLSGVLDSYLADIEDASDSGSFAENMASPITADRDLATISKYLAFIRRRAKGTVPTDAQMIRNFIKNHPEYQEDEVLGEGVWYDLVRRVEQLNEGRRGSVL